MFNVKTFFTPFSSVSNVNLEQEKMLTGKSALCWYNTETCLRHCGIFVMRFVTKIVNGWKIFFPNKSCTK